MRRILPTIFLIATLAGVFSPITTIFTGDTQARIGIQTVYAESGDLDNKIEAQVKEQQDAQDDDSLLYKNINCGISRLGQCMEFIFFVIPYSVGAGIMSLSARLLDITASMTLSSSLYRTGGDENFLAKSWKITRDFSNMFFILILLYIALSMILGLDIGHASPKKLIASTIIIAIVINFSFFLTTIVIDASNSLALVFYNQIVVVPKDAAVEMPDPKKPVIPGTDVKERPIAQALAQAFQPQVFQSQTFFEKIREKNNGTVVMITMLIVIGLIYLVVAYSFVVAALSFIGRLVTLWILIIFAPFAFITSIIPHMGDKLNMLGWKGWLNNLMSAAFSAPIYFFFLLLISFLARATFVDESLLESADWKTILVVVLISALLLVLMLLEGTKFIKKGSGVIGETVSGLVGKGAAFVGGAALGMASGGLAIAGRRTLGAMGQSTLDNEKLKDRAASGSWAAKQQLKAASWSTKSSFDPRHTKVMGEVAAATGLKVNALGGMGIASMDKTKGGLAAEEHRRADKAYKMKELLSYDKGKKKDLEDAAEKRKNSMEVLKSDIAVTKAKDPKDPALATMQEELKKLQHGNGEKWKTAEVTANRRSGVINPTTGKIFSKSDVGTVKKEVVGSKRADGSVVTKEEALKHMSVAEIEKAAKNVENSRYQQYVAQKAEKEGFHASTKLDSFGSITGLHVDTKQAIRDNTKRIFTEAMAKAGVGAAIGGAVAGIPGVVGGALSGFVVQGVREGINLLQTNQFGARRAVAEGLHHASEADFKPHEHKHDDHGHKKMGWGIAETLKGAVKGAGLGGGGGGGSSSGGGGHH